MKTESKPTLKVGVVCSFTDSLYVFHTLLTMHWLSTSVFGATPVILVAKHMFFHLFIAFMKLREFFYFAFNFFILSDILCKFERTNEKLTINYPSCNVEVVLFNFWNNSRVLGQSDLSVSCKRYEGIHSPQL